MCSYNKVFYEKINDIYEEKIQDLSKRVGPIVRMAKLVDELNDHGEIERAKDLSPINEAITLRDDIIKFESAIINMDNSIRENIDYVEYLTTKYYEFKRIETEIASNLYHLRDMKYIIFDIINKLQCLEEDS